MTDDKFPRWSIGIILASLVPIIGWVIMQLIETDRTQESVLTRLNSLEARTSSLFQAIDVRSSDRFTGTQWTDKALILDETHLRLWDAITGNRRDIRRLDTECVKE